MTGTAQASGAMVGQNLGARKTKRAKQTVWYCLGMCMAICGILSILAWCFPEELFGIFTKDKKVLEFGAVYMDIMIIHFMLSAITVSFQSMIIGCGYALLNLIVGLLDGFICRIGFSLLFVYIMNMGAAGYFWGTAFSRSLPAVICFLYFISGRWKKRKLLVAE